MRLFIAGCALIALLPADPSQRFVYPGKDGKLVYDRDDRGNRIPDFSHSGYGGGGVAIPEAPVRVVVSPAAGDNRPRIQAAIDYVSSLPLDANGLRGAVLLLAGRHNVAGSLRISASGVVLRGQPGTTIIATGKSRRTLIQIAGKPDLTKQTPRAIVDAYVPTGSYRLRLDSAKDLKVGDTILVEHSSTKKWISALGMDRFPSRDVGSYLDWRPGKMDLHWDRIITNIEGDTITLDAPLTMALDAGHGQSSVHPYLWPGRLNQVGVENLQLISEYDPANSLDEEHAWNAIGIEDARNVWVRQVKGMHFARSLVSVWESCKHVTIEDCESEHPVSEIAGYRRHTFYTSGQMTLFRRCKSQAGRHDFAVGYLAAGPNAFVECQATDAHQFSGPIESWACGVLYDNVHIDGGGLALTNRETGAQGAGWSAATSVLWQCTAPVITCRMPPTARNWAIGCWGQFVGDGHWRSLNEFVKPQSLYFAQLAERLGPEAVERMERRKIVADPGPARNIDDLAKGQPKVSTQKKPLGLKNGMLLCDGKPVIGGRASTVWWRGHVLPSRAGEWGIGITRFVPGRDGRGFTDDLAELADDLRRKNQVVLEHHWGLWYDRRRDDHQMIRRMDGEVWPPFYEQPWARSGKGKAWDGLSKYDLTRFNPWYFSRLKEFADLCDEKGLVLVQQMYFQHNVLEAGAHWADFPWRPANCLQATGFPEPPPYVNNKRIFMAEPFYDVSHPVRRDLHRRYIRHCLDVLGGNSNVIFQTGEEFTGPLHFVEFWLDTITEWEREKRRKVLVGLSCTKDVQDAILADPVRGPRVSIIDLRYWWYTANGGIYDPKGGENLAPRQQLREWKGSKSRSDESLARQVREYRKRYPDKAVVNALSPSDGWAVLAAGGSIVKLPASSDARLLAALTNMQPLESPTLTVRQWALAAPGRDYFVHSTGDRTIRLDLSGAAGTFDAWWVDRATGQLRPHSTPVSGGAQVEVSYSGSGPALIWLTRRDRSPK